MKKNYSKTMSTFNGNKQRITTSVPSVFIPKFGNDIAKNHFIKNTGLKLKEYGGGYIANPKSFKQLCKIFITCNYETTYYNNADYENTILLNYKTK